MKNLTTLFVITLFFLAGCKDPSTNSPVVEPEYSISGTVTEDIDVIDVLSDATITIGTSEYSTDIKGDFTIQNIKAGEVQLIFNHPDFSSKIITMLLDRDTTLTIGLSRNMPEYFPNNPGCKWHYAIFDSVHSEITEANLEIVDRYLSDDTLLVTRYLVMETNSIEYYSGFTTHGDIEFNSFFDLALKKPFTVGEKYVAGNYHSEVVGSEALLTTAGSFTAFKTVTRVPAEDDFIYRTSWVVPGIGIVKINMFTYGIFGVSQNETWELESFEIK